MSEYYDDNGYLTDAGFDADYDTLEAARAARSQADQPARSQAGDHFDDHHQYTVPEGIVLTPVEIKQHANALGLTTKQTQAMLNYAPEFFSQQRNNAWAKESMAQFTDADIKAARSMLKRVGSPGLTEQLNKTGMGSHPAFIKMFADAERKLQGKGATSLAQQLYPSMNP
jgi:hypothetical protein